MTTKLFISSTDVKNNTAIEKNVEDTRLKQAILHAQNIHIQEITGSAWYDSLAGKRTEEQTWTGLTASEETFIESYLNFALREFALYEYLFDANFNISNQSIEKQSATNSVSAELEEVKMLAERARSRADFYRERCLKFLCDNSELFPLYDDSNQNLYPNRNSFGAGNITPV